MAQRLKLTSLSADFRTEEGKDHSLAFHIDEAHELEDMKTAMEELNVPEERCFFKNEELEKENSSGEKPYIVNCWNAANDFQVKVARLAWLMKYEEKD